ncbi:ATP-dependent DNA helicase [Enhygromyxa salina]|uniref:ATP-dependent DNA helicase n=1 Tax=Enhygromyxa salina TaxID=215803 RepID=A0A0C1ZSN9_9BACT|nr:ATP-dependent DNA helicase [Enhygromyxa salina]
MESFLRRAGSQLAGEHYSLDDKLRRLNVVRRTNGHEVPINAALLFFKHEPQRRFRGAQVDIVQFNEDKDVLHEQRITGTLPNLIEQALTVIEGFNKTQVRKHDDRAQADRYAAWPFAAIEEALVNAVHHRGYGEQYPDPIQVFIHPDRLVITSYPGPMPGLTHEQLDSGEVVRVPARNRLVGELLQAIELAEARGSGIGTIRRAMERAGNPPPRFAFNEPERTYFEVTLPIHPALLPSAQALPLRVGVPALASELIGRQALIEQVLHTSRHKHVCLLGPRGRGVSSVLNGFEAKLTEAPVRLDLKDVDRERLARFLKKTLESRVEEPVTLLLDDLDEQLDHDLAVLSLLPDHPQLRLIVAPVRVFEGDGSWWEAFEPIVVPPLSSADARTLARQLLTGVARDPTSLDAWAQAIADESAGIPSLIHLLVQRMFMNPGQQGAADIHTLMLELVAKRGDPTGLRRRMSDLGGVLGPQVDALDRVADASAGLSRDDLVLALSDDMTVVDAHEVVQRLLEAGWLVARDRRINFEHPVLRDEWQERRKGRRG